MATYDPAAVRRPAPQIPAATVDLLRADVLRSATELVHEIERHVPEYAPTGDGSHARALRGGVELALRRYVDLLDQHARPSATTGPQDVAGGEAIDWREVYRTVGANEMRAGRSLDGLHAATRTCARVANRRLRAFAARHALSPDAVAWLAERIFDNIDDIAQASAEGYARAREAEAGELDRRRRRLVEVLLADPPPSVPALAAAAATARWRLPRRLAAVAIAAPGPLTRAPTLVPEILTGYDREQPCLIVPDPEGHAQMRVLVNGLAAHHAAVGLAVPPTEAGASLRWARLALDLAANGFVPRQPLIWCGDHLAALAVFQDRALIDALNERQLAPLARLRDDRRALLADTLLAWLTFNMNANEVAAHLHVHPQTVRHRLRQLTDLFGDRIRDPRQRLELEIALRAERARAGRGRRPRARPRQRTVG
ncbi:CdaR family transcriptional regulator [Micromonospora sp. KC723]|uniref:PucR family transcriptional regulator n=1 Tax=Micromonospora sp. KC723 TaxID=2530381 RepID=UPI001053082C|nr:helix-turn-helix domain-containing protein [Micromonospora sp. KC723]TDB75493.1 PucR family transcriptional regulator [Micromonospora sp. KC723]